MVEQLWHDRQVKLLSSLIAPQKESVNTRPKYFNMKVKKKSQIIRDILGIGINLNISTKNKLKLENDDSELNTMDILQIALDLNIK
jgi:UV DNA damage repair endonuclease